MDGDVAKSRPKKKQRIRLLLLKQIAEEIKGPAKGWLYTWLRLNTRKNKYYFPKEIKEEDNKWSQERKSKMRRQKDETPVPSITKIEGNQDDDNNDDKDPFEGTSFHRMRGWDL